MPVRLLAGFSFFHNMHSNKKPFRLGKGFYQNEMPIFIGQHLVPE
jgi:hypothetical protein